MSRRAKGSLDQIGMAFTDEERVQVRRRVVVITVEENMADDGSTKKKQKKQTKKDLRVELATEGKVAEHCRRGTGLDTQKRGWLYCLQRARDGWSSQTVAAYRA